MLRRLFKILAALSLLLCVTVVVLWVRSYWVNDGWVHAGAGSVSFGRLGRGKLMVMSVDREPGTRGGERVTWKAWVDWEDHPVAPGAFSASHARSSPSLPGVRVYSGTQEYLRRTGDLDLQRRLRFEKRTFHLVAVSYWLPFILTLLPVTPFVMRRVRRLIPRRLPGTCGRCGYDLRATPGRCPECGAVPAAKET